MHKWRVGDMARCVDAKDHCHTIEVGGRYFVAAVQEGRDGKPMLVLSVLLRAWPAEQFVYDGAN